MTTNEVLHSNLAIPPGEYLEEVLEELGMSKDELSRRMGRPSTKLSQIFKGEKAITSDTALQLEKVVGVPAHIWTGLEAEYRLTLARLEDAQEVERLKDETQLISTYPYNELVKVGEVPKHTTPIDRVRALQEFFGVVSLNRIYEIKRYQVAFRCGRSKRGEQSPQAIAAWLRMGERTAQRRQFAPFNEDKLRASLKTLRSFTLQAPEVFLEKLYATLASCGVALVVCPHFAKTKVHGATFWLGRDKAVLMITIRGKYADIFWFSLFHEIGHILLHGRQAVILENNDGNSLETEADEFASDVLIPPDDYRTFIEQASFYPNDIESFAKRIKIDPGIVVGRLHYEKRLPQAWGNKLRTLYDWVRPE